MGLVEELILTDVYAEVAAKEGVDVPDDDMKPFTVTIDDAEFDPTDLEAEVKRS
jgi:nitrate/nitrite transport system substrate-binding protein